MGAPNFWWEVYFCQQETREEKKVTGDYIRGIG